MSHTRNKKWKCLDCGTDTKHEHYFVHLELWMNAVGSKNGMLCVVCWLFRKTNWKKIK